MAATAGICTQTTKCQVAKSGRIVAVPLGESFVCPECGNGLAPPTQLTPEPVVKRSSSTLPLALVGVGLFVLGGAIFVGRELGGGGSAPAPALAVRTPAPAAPAQATVAAAAPAPTPLPPVPLPVLPPLTPAPATTAALPPPATSVAALPAPLPAPIALPTAPVPAPVAPAPTQLAALQSPPPKTPAAKPVAPPPAAVALAAPPAPVPEPPPAALPPDAPFSPTPETGGTPTYPAELAADGRVGKVNVTCQISADGTPTGCRATSRSGPAFATATLAWLTHGHVKFHPIILHGRPLAASRSWTVMIEEPPAVLAEARRKQKEEAAAAAPAPTASNALRPQTAPIEPIHAPVQQAMARQVLPSASSGGGPDVPFSTHTIAGGAPTFPAYYDEGRPGAVTVSCTIEPSGSPSGCHIVRQLGGSGFGKAVDQWLGSGRVRFRPILVNGQPVSKQETWTVIFNSMPQPAYGQ